MTKIAIGPLAAELIPSFHRALDCVARERRYLTFLEAPPLDETRAFVLAGQRNGDPRVVALVNEEVVGWCDISRHHRPAHAHRGTLGMGIIPSFRGQGIGFQLISAALEKAWLSNMTRIELNVFADNAAAISLYGKAGFIREGVIRDAVRVDGNYRDAIAMAILRRPAIST